MADVCLNACRIISGELVPRLLNALSTAFFFSSGVILHLLLFVVSEVFVILDVDADFVISFGGVFFRVNSLDFALATSFVETVLGGDTLVDFGGDALGGEDLGVDVFNGGSSFD